MGENRTDNASLGWNSSDSVHIYSSKKCIGTEVKKSWAPAITVSLMNCVVLCSHHSIDKIKSLEVFQHDLFKCLKNNVVASVGQAKWSGQGRRENS